ncbi:MAG: AraC family transcriptional regulator [Bacteroidales bacterium]|nr:AraC family transcriptional regulator [Bacteroidales bacterium]
METQGVKKEPLYERLKGNLPDVLAVGAAPLCVERAGVFLCLNGAAEIVLDGVRYRIETGSLCLYFPYSVLEVRRRSDDLDGMMMAVDLDAVSPLISRVTEFDGLLALRQRPVVRLTAEMHRVIHGYMLLYLHHARLAERYGAEGRRRLWQLNELQLERARECLVLQVVIAFTGEDAKTKSTVNRKDEIVHQFFRCLREHYRLEHEVGFYADKQCLSMRYFSFVVRERTSQTPSFWIANALLTDAKQLIVETDKTVKEVAEWLHFPNQSYFGKWFKAHTGMGPVEWKRHVDRAKGE